MDEFLNVNNFYLDRPRWFQNALIVHCLTITRIYFFLMKQVKFMALMIQMNILLILAME